jgi:hypothetical protein
MPFVHGSDVCVSRILDALGLGKAEGVTKLSLQIEASSVATVTVTRMLRPTELDSLALVLRDDQYYLSSLEADPHSGLSPEEEVRDLAKLVKASVNGFPASTPVQS